MVPLIEEILISAFFTKMGNRPPSNKTGPNQLIWTDSENSKELKLSMISYYHPKS